MWKRVIIINWSFQIWNILSLQNISSLCLCSVFAPCYIHTSQFDYFETSRCCQYCSPFDWLQVFTFFMLLHSVLYLVNCDLTLEQQTNSRRLLAERLDPPSPSCFCISIFYNLLRVRNERISVQNKRINQVDGHYLGHVSSCVSLECEILDQIAHGSFVIHQISMQMVRISLSTRCRSRLLCVYNIS